MKAELLSQLVEDRRNERATVLAVNLDTGEQTLLYPLEADSENEAARTALLNDRSKQVDGPDGRLFLQVHNTPLRMVLAGAVHVAQPLARMASYAGFAVSVVDPREAFNTEARFPGMDRLLSWPDAAMERLGLDHRTAVVVLTHDPKLDDPALVAALSSPAFYIGALGSRMNQAKRLERMREAGFDEATLARIHGPVGLDIGARTPEEIAAAIMAEVIRELRRDPS